MKKYSSHEKMSLETAHFYFNQTYVKVLLIKECGKHSEGKNEMIIIWLYLLFRLVRRPFLSRHLGPSHCCSFQSFARCNLDALQCCSLRCTCTATERAAEALTAVTLLVYIPGERRRVTGVCVQHTLPSARQVWVRLSRKQQAKFKLHLRDLNTWRNAQVQTLSSRQSS